jgi:hypothetical protein
MWPFNRVKTPKKTIHDLDYCTITEALDIVNSLSEKQLLELDWVKRTRPSDYWVSTTDISDKYLLKSKLMGHNTIQFALVLKDTKRSIDSQFTDSYHYQKLHRRLQVLCTLNVDWDDC